MLTKELRQIVFSVNCRKWFDKVNGNTYFSCLVVDNRTSEQFVIPYEYGYDNQYQQTTLDELLKRKLLPLKYNKDNVYLYERENNYPILWTEAHGLKRNMYKTT